MAIVDGGGGGEADGGVTQCARHCGTLDSDIWRPSLTESQLRVLIVLLDVCAASTPCTIASRTIPSLCFAYPHPRPRPSMRQARRDGGACAACALASTRAWGRVHAVHPLLPVWCGVASEASRVGAVKYN